MPRCERQALPASARCIASGQTIKAMFGTRRTGYRAQRKICTLCQHRTVAPGLMDMAAAFRDAGALRVRSRLTSPSLCSRDNDRSC